MKILFLSIALLAAITQTQAQDFTLPKPQGWGTEEFALPPSFAPSITYKGTEILRFAPGWADSTAPGYWTYLFAWQVEGTISTNPDSLKRQLMAYYNGLYVANKKQPPAGYGPAFTQARVTENALWPNDKASFTGKAYTYNYLTGRQLDLLFKIHLRHSPNGKRSVLLFEASPKPYDDAIWKTFDPILTGANFKP